MYSYIHSINEKNLLTISEHSYVFLFIFNLVHVSITRPLYLETHPESICIALKIAEAIITAVSGYPLYIQMGQVAVPCHFDRT